MNKKSPVSPRRTRRTVKKMKPSIVKKTAPKEAKKRYSVLINETITHRVVVENTSKAAAYSAALDFVMDPDCGFAVVDYNVIASPNLGILGRITTVTPELVLPDENSGCGVYVEKISEYIQTWSDDNPDLSGPPNSKNPQEWDVLDNILEFLTEWKKRDQNNRA